MKDTDLNVWRGQSRVSTASQAAIVMAKDALRVAVYGFTCSYWWGDYTAAEMDTAPPDGLVPLVIATCACAEELRRAGARYEDTVHQIVRTIAMPFAARHQRLLMEVARGSCAMVYERDPAFQ